MAIHQPIQALQTPSRKRHCRTDLTRPLHPPKPHVQAETAVALAEGAGAFMVARAELDAMAVGARLYLLSEAEVAVLAAAVAAEELDQDAVDGTAENLHRITMRKGRSPRATTTLPTRTTLRTRSPLLNGSVGARRAAPRPHTFLKPRRPRRHPLRPPWWQGS